MTARNRDSHNRWRSITVGFRVSPEENEQINAAVPVFLAGCAAGLSRSMPPATEVIDAAPPALKEVAKQLETSEADIDWVFLNG